MGSFERFFVLFVFSSRPGAGVLQAVVKGRFYPGVAGVAGEIGSDGL